MNPSEGEGMSSENVITAEQLEKQIQKSIALRTLIDRTLKFAADDIKRDYGLFQRHLEEHIHEIAHAIPELEEDLSKV